MRTLTNKVFKLWCTFGLGWYLVSYVSDLYTLPVHTIRVMIDAIIVVIYSACSWVWWIEFPRMDRRTAKMNTYVKDLMDEIEERIRQWETPNEK